MVGVNLKAIPAELRLRSQWVCWKYAQREGEPKPTKVPVNARTVTSLTLTGFMNAQVSFRRIQSQQMQARALLLGFRSTVPNGPLGFCLGPVKEELFLSLREHLGFFRSLGQVMNVISDSRPRLVLF